jgi:hypothetical protein
MMNNQKKKANGLRNRGRQAGRRLQKRQPFPDNALLLRPEYKGQPVASFIISSTPIVLSTTVTTGAIAQNTTLSGAILPNFATRFAAWSDYRIVKIMAKVSSFSSTNPGLINHWFSEEDAAAPTSAKAQNAQARRFPACDISQNVISYTPHDPSQQTWTLVASQPTIGYYKLYTNNADFGASIVATQYLLLEFESTVQLRGFI